MKAQSFLIATLSLLLPLGLFAATKADLLEAINKYEETHGTTLTAQEITLLMNEGKLPDPSRGGPLESKEAWQGAAMVGVDDLGRVMVALDTNRNELADRCFIFTAEDRLEGGPWTAFIQNAHISYATTKEGGASLIVKDRARQIAVGVSTIKSKLPHISDIDYGRVYSVRNGVELASVNPSDVSLEGPLLASMDHGDLESWPESFWYDFHDPASVDCERTDPKCRNQDPQICRTINTRTILGDTWVPCLDDKDCTASCPSSQDYACCACKIQGFLQHKGWCRCKPCPPIQ